MGVIDQMSNESANRARTEAALNSDYTFKEGDFRMLMNGALSSRWNDNINCTETGKESDFIILPTVGVTMTYPVTTINLLQLNVTAGYSDYVSHPGLSSWYLSSGSGLSFDTFIGNSLKVNLHDQFSYEQNTSENPAVAGTGTYGTFDNSGGVIGDWTGLRNMDFTVGYDHMNTQTTSGTLSQSDDASDAGYIRAGYIVDPKLTAGAETSASYTYYAEAILGDYTSYSAGVYADWHPDKFLEVEPRVGYSINQFGQTSFVQSSSLDSWYADLMIIHQITKWFSYSLDMGHQITPGVQSSASENYYANLGITWKFMKNFAFAPQFSYQHGIQGAGSTVLNDDNGNLLPSNGEIYDWYSGSIGFNYAITRRFTIGVNYDLTVRTSSLSDRSYTQNVIGLQISYRPI